MRADGSRNSKSEFSPSEAYLDSLRTRGKREEDNNHTGISNKKIIFAENKVNSNSYCE